LVNQMTAVFAQRNAGAAAKRRAQQAGERFTGSQPGTLFMTSPASRSAPILSTASRTARVRVAP